MFHHNLIIHLYHLIINHIIMPHLHVMHPSSSSSYHRIICHHHFIIHLHISSSIISSIIHHLHFMHPSFSPSYHHIFIIWSSIISVFSSSCFNIKGVFSDHHFNHYIIIFLPHPKPPHRTSVYNTVCPCLNGHLSIHNRCFFSIQ